MYSQSVDNWRGEHSYIVFCIIKIFWNRLFLRFVDTNILMFEFAGYALLNYLLGQLIKLVDLN